MQDYKSVEDMFEAREYAAAFFGARGDVGLTFEGFEGCFLSVGELLGHVHHENRRFYGKFIVSGTTN